MVIWSASVCIRIAVFIVVHDLFHKEEHIAYTGMFLGYSVILLGVRIFRSKFNCNFAELSGTARLLSVAITGIGISSDRFTERYARLNDLDINFVTVAKTLDNNIDLQLTLTLNEYLVEFGIVNNDKCRIFFMQCM